MAKNDDNEDLQAPQALITALKELESEEIFIPRTIDEAILREASQHLTRRSKQPRSTKLWLSLWVSAGAAMVVVALFIMKPVSNSSSQPTYAREDLNHDGRVDILDALALAKRIAQPGKADIGLDLNGDGKVDEQDAAMIARHAVRLDKGGRS